LQFCVKKIFVATYLHESVNVANFYKNAVSKQG